MRCRIRLARVVVGLVAAAWLVAGSAGSAGRAGSAASPAGDPTLARPTMNDLALASDAQLPAGAELEALLAASCGAGNVRAGKPGESPRCAAVAGYPTVCQDLRFRAAVPGHFTAAAADA